MNQSIPSKTQSILLKKVKKEHIPNDHLPVSFGVKSLFTNVPLDETSETILNRIYEKNKISTDITKSEMKELLNLRTKSVHFTFEGNIMFGMTVLQWVRHWDRFS